MDSVTCGQKRRLASGKIVKLIIPFCTFKKCVSFRPGQNILSKTISLGISLEAPKKTSNVVLLTLSNHYDSTMICSTFRQMDRGGKF